MKNTHETLSLFDFDKTLIHEDSFRIFSLSASNSIWEKILVLFLAFCNKSKFISNSYYKKSVLKIVWIKKGKRDKELFLEDFIRVLQKKQNKKVVNALKKHVDLGDKVIIISASPSFYLNPFVKLLSENIEVLGSHFRVRGGQMEFFNLYGTKKMLSAEKIIKKINPRIIWLYTDHISDMPLIKLADRIRLINPSSKFIKKLNQLKIDYEIY
jgi:HAD superfamily phosphoserine phosphatase-like hydrolase